MNYWNYIINPINKQKFILNSRQGSQILAKYILHSGYIQNGGVTPLLAIAGVDISVSAIAGISGFLICIGGGICYLMSGEEAKKIKEDNNIVENQDLSPEIQDNILKEFLKNQEAVDAILSNSSNQLITDKEIEQELEEIEKNYKERELIRIANMTAIEREKYLENKQLEEEIDELEKMLDKKGGADTTTLSLTYWILCIGGVSIGSYICYKLGLFSSDNILENTDITENNMDINKIEQSIIESQKAIIKLKDIFKQIVLLITNNKKKLKSIEMEGSGNKQPIVIQLKKNLENNIKQKNNIKSQIITLHKSLKTFEKLLERIKNDENVSFSLSYLGNKNR